VAIDAAQAGHFVAHSLGLENVPDTKVVKPSLMTVAQAMGRQAWAQR
jgi:hypothetical protein